MRAGRLVVALALIAVGRAPLMRGAEAAPGPVPRPETVLGFRPGDDYKLANYAQLLRYFRAVDEVSDRVELRDIGESEMGRPMILAIVTAPANFEHLERYREIARRLALARGLTDDQAHALAGEGKAVVSIDAGLHATEVAHSQHAFELLYHLASDDGAETRAVLENVILLLLPCVNPDGLDLTVDWYERNLGTPYEVSPLPELYAKYVGHDNNRDWFMFTQAETRNVGRILYHEWLPQIVYDHHQSGPFPARIFIPPFDDPVNPHIPPLVMRGVQLVGSAMAHAFAERGKPGVISHTVFSTWWNGGLRTAAYFHNMVGILSETALYRYATPKFYPDEEIPSVFPRVDLSAREPSTFYPNPWRGGWWRLRDAVEYMTIGSLAVLDVAARYREHWLYDIYRMGRDAIARGEAEPPYAFVIPRDQPDPNTAVELVNALREGAVEVHRAEKPFTADGRLFPEGSFVLLTAQPFRPYLLDLMTPQKHPHQSLYPGGPPKPPYDVTGWTLPPSMGVEAVAIPEAFEARLVAVDRAAPPVGRIEGGGEVYLLDPRVNDSFLAVNRLAREGASIYRSRDAVASLPPGTFVVTPLSNGRDVERLADDLGLVIRRVSRIGGRGWKIVPPRVGLYRSWVASADEGWTRWLFDRFELPYRSLRDAELREPGLRDRYDVIVIPGETPLEKLIQGHPEGTMPPEYVGGMGREGVDRLEQFVRSGGTLVCLDSAGDLPLEYFNLPVENALAGLSEEEFYCPGSELQIELDPTHPIAYGMDPRATAFFRNSRAYNLVAELGGEGVAVVARYPDRDPLVSGWIHGEERLRKKAAIVDVPYGDGRVVLIGFRAQFRGQTHGTYKLLFNALYYGAAEPQALP